MSPAGLSPPQQHLQQLEVIFHATLSVPVAERTAHARLACSHDPTLLADLLELLASDSSVEDLLATPVALAPTYLLQRSVDQGPEHPDPWLGRQVGPFRLDRLLGRGGMGVVYLGCRTTGFTQSVAIKVIARPLRTGPALDAFLLERDALARLEHRNIARLLDGGVTAEGVPYIAMEYVEGRRLDQLCDDPATTLEHKVQLMFQLCEAVAYVHRNLILHRDLKPGNVMVNREGVLKLLDFGTAKLLGPLAANSVLTQAGIRPITLRYASPEHVRGVDVSTASDLYSLGMVLFRLTTGHLPGAPPTSSKPGESSPLTRDLLAIARKAIRDEPAARYVSAEAFAADLTRALEDRPVLARAGTLRYRTHRFFRRNRLLLAGFAAAGLILLAGVAAMTWQARVARAQTRRAEAGIEGERRLAHLLLFDYFEQLRDIPGSTDAQRRTVSEALTYLDSLTTSGAAITSGSALAADAVEAYTKLGQVQGSPYEENLGDAPGAIRTLHKAVDLGREVVQRDPTNLLGQQDLAAAELALGRIRFGTGHPADALPFYQAAADTSTLIAKDPHATAAMIAQSASVWDGFGDLYDLEGAASLNDRPRAIAAYTQATAYDKAALALQHDCARCLRGIALGFWKLGVQVESTNTAEAAADYSQGLLTLLKFSPEDRLTTRNRRLDTLLRDRLGSVQLKLHHNAEAVQALEEVRTRFREAIARDPIDSRARFDLAALDPDLADAYAATGDPAKALEADTEMLTIMNVLLKRDPGNAQWQKHRADASARCSAMQHRMAATLR